MTQIELEKLYLETEHGIFTPIYNYEEYDQETDTYMGLVIIKTAQEVYDEWLTNKDKPVETPVDKISDLEKKVAYLESIEAGLLLENANHQIKLQKQEIKNKEQEVTNANLLLEIAMLKGVI